jgi:VCBS repeat-containing protein
MAFVFSGCGGGGDDSPTPTINPQNTKPTATFTTLTAIEDTNKTATLTATDADGDTLTFHKVTDPSNGIVTIDTNGTFTYTPNVNYNGADSFTYKVNDNTIDSATQTVNITISSVNDTPTINPQNTKLLVTEDIAKTSTLTATDADGDTLTFHKVTDPSNGIVTIDTNGTFTYTPNVNYNGADSFTYKVNDNTIDSATQTVNITITSVNDIPTINTIFSNISIDDNTSKKLDINISDIDGDSLTLSIDTNDTNLTITPNFTNPLAQADYKNITLDFNISSEYNISALVKVTLTLSDDESNDTKSFDVNITNTQESYVFNIGKLATGQTTTYKEFDDGNTTRGTKRNFTNNGNDTVTDNVTKLMWQNEAYTSAEATAYSNDTEVGKALHWATAKTYCENLTLASKNDWYLPTIEELVSITDKGKSNPSIDPAFTNVVSSYYWSATTYASDTSNAWYVYFDYGYDYNYYKTSTYYVRCVRPAD